MSSTHLERPETIHRADVETAETGRVCGQRVAIEHGVVVEHPVRDGPIAELQGVYQG
jgi:hypothetical protein